MAASGGADRLRQILGTGAEEESELGFHLQMRIRDLEAVGLSPAAARERAEREFGDGGAIEWECRTVANRRNRTCTARNGWGSFARISASAAGSS